MARIKKYISAIIISFILTGALYYFFTAGDYLLEYLFKSMRLEISYSNSCNFVNTFITRKAALRNVNVQSADGMFKIMCSQAKIAFDYSTVDKKIAVGLDITLNEPRVNLANVDISSYLPNELSGVSDIINGKNVKSISALLCLYGDTVEINDLTMISKDIILKINGYATNANKVELRVKLLLSPEFSSGLPENAKNMLFDKGRGYKGYELNVLNDPGKKYFKLDSPCLKFELGSNLS